MLKPSYVDIWSVEVNETLPALVKLRVPTPQGQVQTLDGSHGTLLCDKELYCFW